MKNRILNKILIIVLFLFLLPGLVYAKEYKDKIYDIVGEKENNNIITVYLFHSSTCPHCKAEISYLEELLEEYNGKVILKKYEVSNPANNTYLSLAKERMNITQSGVPYTIIGEETFMGYSTYVSESIKETIDDYINSNDDIKEVEEEKTFNLPILGKIEATKVSIPLVAVVLGFIDGFNPCAMWVLLFLINMLFNMKNRKKMWLLGITFLLTSALVYFLAMLGLSVVLSFTAVVWVRRIIAVVAIIGGLINLKSYIETPKDGCTVVDEKKRKKYFTRIKKFTEEPNIFIALAGVIVLAASVNLVELACSAGFPTIFVSILDLNNVSILNQIIYFAIYILFYLIDDLVIFIISMVTLKISGITTKYNRLGHLIGGVIMILIGLLLIFKPEWIMLNF